MIICYIDILCLYLLLLFFYRKLTRRLMPKVRDWSGRARAAHHGVSGQARRAGASATAVLTLAPMPPALHCCVVAMCMFSARARVRNVSKHAIGLAAGTDKSSSLSRPDTGSRNRETRMACGMFGIRRWPPLPLSNFDSRGRITSKRLD